LNWKKTTSAAFEQGAVSALNFGALAVLGVLLTPKEFSSYVVLMSLLTIGYLINATLWGSPSLVLSQTTYADHQQSYARTLLIVSLLSSILTTLFVSASFFFLPSAVSLSTWGWAVMAGVSWSAYEVFRRVSFSTGNLYLLAGASLTVLVLYSACISAALLLTGISLETAFLVWFISFSSGLIILGRKLFATSYGSTLDSGVSFGAVVVSHWLYARWQLLGAFAFWVSSSGFIFLASYVLENEEVAALRLVQNLFGLSNLLLLLLENLLTPRGGRIYRGAGVPGVVAFVKSLYRIYVIPYLLGVVVISIASLVLYQYLYFDIYKTSPLLLVYFFLIYLLMGLIFPLLTALRVMSKTKFFWYGHAASACFMLTGGVGLLIFRGVLGGGLAFLASALIFASVIFASFWGLITTSMQSSTPR
jgi:hypothetical protein